MTEGGNTMPRLTQKGTDYCKDICDDHETFNDCLYYHHRDALPKDCAGRCVEAQIYEKLQEYEDKEETE